MPHRNGFNGEAVAQNFCMATAESQEANAISDRTHYNYASERLRPFQVTARETLAYDAGRFASMGNKGLLFIICEKRQRGIEAQDTKPPDSRCSAMPQAASPSLCGNIASK